MVETQALVKALGDGHLRGAGLDVVEEEGVVKDELAFLVSGDSSGHDLRVLLANHVLIDMPNVIMTPHSAFNTDEALRRILEATVENIRALNRREARNIVQVSGM